METSISGCGDVDSYGPTQVHTVKKISRNRNDAGGNDSLRASDVLALEVGGNAKDRVLESEGYIRLRRQR